MTDGEIVTAASVRHDGVDRTAFDTLRGPKAIDRSDPYGDPSKTLPQFERRQPSIDRDAPQSRSPSSVAEGKTSQSGPGA